MSGRTLDEFKAMANGGEVWLDAPDYERLVEVIPPGGRFSSSKVGGENIRFPLTAPLTTIFRRRNGSP